MDTTTLTATERARQINQEFQVWMSQGPDRGGFMLVEDAAHWSEYGINTGDQLDRYLAYCDLVDTYKDIHGIKPRWLSWETMTLAEITKMLENLYEGEKARVEYEAMEEARIARKTREATEVTPFKVTLGELWPR